MKTIRALWCWLRGYHAFPEHHHPDDFDDPGLAQWRGWAEYSCKDCGKTSRIHWR
jgi:hypothetical protein